MVTGAVAGESTRRLQRALGDVSERSQNWRENFLRHGRGGFSDGQNAKEFKLMTDLGMSPLDALKVRRPMMPN